jgi:diguanylate cyclase (GGDEF)-like protein
MALLRRLRAAVWPVPEPALADAGREGEIVVAQARLAFLAANFFVPLATLLRHPGDLGGRAGIGITVAMLGVGWWALAKARAGEGGGALAFATTAFDVTCVTAYHVLLLVGGAGATAFNSRVTFAIYLFAIFASTLRYDGRVCTFGGLLAVAQWVGVIAWAHGTGVIHQAASAGLWYGDTDIAGQAEEVIILLMWTGFCALSVDRVRRLRLSSTRDPLTRVANRGYFEERVQQELSRAQRSGTPMALAVLDLDHFKRVNDTFGHPAGDAVLQQVAGRLKRELRAADLVARLGGEEFAIVLPGATRDAARETLDRLRQQLAADPIELPGGRQVRVTITAGVAATPADGVDVVQLVDAADARLLAGKRRSRDVVVAAD